MASVRTAGLPVQCLSQRDFLFPDADDVPDGNQFSPKELSVPADQKVKITVKNLDATPAEFESYDLNREKVVSANSEIILFVDFRASSMEAASNDVQLDSGQLTNFCIDLCFDFHHQFSANGTPGPNRLSLGWVALDGDTAPRHQRNHYARKSATD